MTSPTQRSLAALKEDAAVLHHQVVEHWVRIPKHPAGGVRRDLFTFIDIVALERTPALWEILTSRTIGIQVCAAASLAARQAKIEAAPALLDLWRAGWIIRVHGWRKTGARGKRKTWACLVRELRRKPPGWEWVEVSK